MNLTPKFTSNQEQNFQVIRDAIAQNLPYTQQDRASLLNELESNPDKVKSFIKYALQHPDEMRRFAF